MECFESYIDIQIEHAIYIKGKGISFIIQLSGKRSIEISKSVALQE